MHTTIKQQLLDKLAEIEDLLEQATCEGEAFADNNDTYDDWAAEINRALSTLTDNIDYYVD